MDFSGKALHLMEGFAAAFQSALPSFHPIDLCVGVAAALLIRLAVYVKGKNARKFRKNIEYGSIVEISVPMPEFSSYSFAKTMIIAK